MNYSLHRITRYFGIILFLGVILTSFAETARCENIRDISDSSPTIVYFFWGDGCPHCHDEKKFLIKLKQKYPNLKIKAFETWHHRENARLYVNMASAFGVKPTGVPATFIGDKVWIGFTDFIEREIEEEVKQCLVNDCIDSAIRLSVRKTIGEIHQNTHSISPYKPVCVHVFLRKGCPQCKAITPYLDTLKNELNVELEKHYISAPKNRDLYENFKKTYGIETAGFPTAFIGKRYLVGTTAIRKNLEREIKKCSKEGCVCPVKIHQALAPYPPKREDVTPEGGKQVNIPGIGSMDMSQLSLPIFTAILGGLDSFNPCAFFVLFVLLGMLIHAKSRTRMALIGGTFVLISGLIYFFFMAAWLNLFLIIGHLTMITIIAGVIALVVSALNIKDYFYFKKGVSLAIPEKAKPKLFQRMRALLKASSITSMMIGTIVLAIAANTYELLCTAGFPMVFTRILTFHELSSIEYYFYLALYNIVYVIPLLLIVVIFVMTLGSRKLTEEQGQILKLISGLMMLCLGLILLIKPALLNNIFVAAAILGVVLITTLLITFVRKLIPKTQVVNTQ